MDFNPVELARQYTEALKRHFGDRLVSVVLYGSAARGDYTPSSDIDLLIIAEGLPASRLERSRILVEMEEKEFYHTLAELHRKGIYTDFSTRMKTPDEARKFTPFYLDLTEDAIILYDKGEFFGRLLERFRERLRELGARRIWRGRTWYWEIKPGLKWGEIREMARSYLATAEHSLKQAKLACEDGMWHLAVRRSQESVEMALKGILRLAGLEAPRRHDFGPLLREHRKYFPQWFQEQIDRLAHISRQLCKEREASLYGEEEEALPPERIFSKFDAEEALKSASFVLEVCARLLEEAEEICSKGEDP